MVEWIRFHSSATTDGNVVVKQFWAPKIKVGNAVWDMDSDSMTVGDSTFVHLRRGGTATSGFSRIVYEAFGDIDERKAWNLNACKGYRELMDLRTEKDKQESIAAEIRKLPEWQRNIAKVKPKRKSRIERTMQRADPQAMSLCVPGVGDKTEMLVDFMKPMQHSDDLWCKADLASLTHVIQYIVSKGIDTEFRTRKYTRDLPKGVRRQVDGRFRVFITDEAREAIMNKNKRAKKSVLVESLEKAQAVLDDPETYGMWDKDDDDADEDDQGHDEDQEAEVAAEGHGVHVVNGGAHGAVVMMG
jgi:hypothetical protein